MAQQKLRNLNPRNQSVYTELAMICVISLSPPDPSLLLEEDICGVVMETMDSSTPNLSHEDTGGFRQATLSRAGPEGTFRHEVTA